MSIDSFLCIAKPGLVMSTLEIKAREEIFQDLAPLLWNSFGTIAALLQEIVSIYHVLSLPTLRPTASNRVCNALALLQHLYCHLGIFIKKALHWVFCPHRNDRSNS
ncbi:uncharacterized protein LOC144706087 [Wolffia australiana]